MAQLKTVLSHIFGPPPLIVIKFVCLYKKIAYNSTHVANFKTLNVIKMVSNLSYLFPAYILLLTLHIIMLINRNLDLNLDLNCDITLTCKFDGKYHFNNG